MRLLIIVLFIVCVTGTATTQHANIDPFTKSDSHILANKTSDDREGGETIEDALPITNVPFYDTGATCDNINDYDRACPYFSLSPDVIYSALLV